MHGERCSGWRRPRSELWNGWTRRDGCPSPSEGAESPAFWLIDGFARPFWGEPKKICVGAPVNPMERPGASPKFESHRHRGAVDDSESHPLAHCKASPVAPRHYRRIRGGEMSLDIPFYRTSELPTNWESNDEKGVS